MLIAPVSGGVVPLVASSAQWIISRRPTSISAARLAMRSRTSASSRKRRRRRSRTSPAEQLEGVRDLEDDAAADRAALVGEGVGQHLPAAVERADQGVGGHPHFVVEDVGEAAVVHRRRRLDR